MKIHYPLSVFIIPTIGGIRFTFYILYFIFFGLFSCSSAPDRVGDLDLVKWRSDRGGCKDIRKTLEDDFKKVEDKILGKHIDEVGQMLGRPDIHQLGKRDQKYYIYFFEKGVHCQDIAQKSGALKAILRFNAVGLLAEITYQTKPIQ